MTKSVRKFTQNQVGREDMGSGQELCPWEGDSEEKILQYYTGGDPPWGKSCSDHTQSTQPWSLTLGRWAHFAGSRASGTNSRAVGSLLVRGMHKLTWSRHRAQREKTAGWLADFPQPPWSAYQPKKNSHSWCTSALGQGTWYTSTLCLSNKGQRLRPKAATEPRGGSHSWCLQKQCLEAIQVPAQARPPQTDLGSWPTPST